MKRFILSALLAFVLLVGFTVPQQAFASPMQVTAQDGLNVRSGPGLEYRVVAIMPAGTVVTPTDWVGEWVQVTYKGTTGWAHSGWLIASNTAQSVGYESACAWAWGYKYCAPPYIARAIYTASAEYGVSGDWLLQIAACESQFVPSAVGNHGELGLFQFLPSTFYAYGGESIWDVWDQSYTAARMFSRGLSDHWSCA